MSDPEISQLLGRIDGKLDQVIAASKEHREDDVRRFSDVYKKLGEHAEDINKAKGGKAVLLVVASGLAGFIAFIGPMVAKAFGLK